MNILLDSSNEIMEDVSFQVLKLSDNKIKIMVHWNQTPSTGYKIKIEEVKFEENKIKVLYKKYKPREDSINCQVISRPVDIWEGMVEGEYDEYYVALVDQ
ncbi:protease complex subunit PrcB family protein [Alkaliphilus hydrothermalis]|uniref:PrcB C-terminal domain-containing protein n=1 Tax=Alkaliphilus hydrothermalis TaxID=1482730 RepID=A0ABS2NMW1_9FIRM|nr:protease complex subunit PrcB family protein [Alkaliphilus hydrothermalis]MBM7614196.1 hypothetical protein [Alkaliphilus hydrothermalis]